MNHPFTFIKSRAWRYFVHWSLWMFTLDEMRMKTAFIPFTLDESPAMHIQSVKCKFALKENGCKQWQQQWTSTGKGAVTKSFFPFVRNRLRQELPVSPDFTSMVKGHGKLRSYFHRFGITDDPTCPCAEAKDHTTDHLIFRCKKLRKQRTEMIKKKTPEAIGQ